MSRAAARMPPSPGAPRPPAPLHRGPARALHPRPSQAAQGHPAPRRRLAPEGPRSHPALLANDRVPRTGVRQASLCPRGRPPRKPRVFVCEVSVEPAYLAQRRAAPRRAPLLAVVAGTLAAEAVRGRFRRRLQRPDSEARPAQGGPHTPRPHASELSAGAGRGWAGAAESPLGHAPCSRPRPEHPTTPPEPSATVGSMDRDECSRSWVG